MFTEKQIPHSITGKELDDHLAKGWYRMGLSVFTTHFIFFDGNLYSPVWLRLPLEGYKFRKSLKKILRVNRDRFKIVIKHGVIDNEKEHLFQKYRASFKGNLSPSLKDSLLDGQTRNIFDTFEVDVFDGEKLIAFSYFDLGDNSLASIKGVYDPEYSRFSLGIYTMLEEIQFGLDLGFKYYYPGYIVPGYSRFDYKLRIGTAEQVEFYDIRSSAWFSLTTFSKSCVPVFLINAKLTIVASALKRVGIPSQLLFYPSFEFGVLRGKDCPILESPLFLSIFSRHDNKPSFIIYFDATNGFYRFTHALTDEEIDALFEEDLKDAGAIVLRNQLLETNLLVSSQNPIHIADAAKSLSVSIKV